MSQSGLRRTDDKDESKFSKEYLDANVTNLMSYVKYKIQIYICFLKKYKIIFSCALRIRSQLHNTAYIVPMTYDGTSAT